MRAPLAAAALILAFVGTALVEPWTAGRNGDGSQPVSSTAQQAVRPQPAAPEPTGPGPAGGAVDDLTLADDLRAAATSRSEWGIRAVVFRPGSGTGEAPEFVDRWTRMPTPSPGADLTAGPILAGQAGDTILAIEITTPQDALVLDLRAWRLDASGARQPVAPRPVRGPDSGTWLWLPDLAGMTDVGAWPGGRYRLEPLVGPAVVPIAVTIPGTEPAALSYRAPPPATDISTRISSWIALSRTPDHLAQAPVITDRDLGGTDGDGTCGGSARITPFDELLGLAAVPGRRAASIRIHAIDSIRQRDQSVRFASDPVSGMTVIALPPGGLAPGQYAVVAGTDGVGGQARQTYTICVT